MRFWKPVEPPRVEGVQIALTPREVNVACYALAHYAVALEEYDKKNGVYGGPLETVAEVRALWERFRR